ncbi:drug/metabolite transporter (DMT)-like permease [Pseudochelatococcus lubricantis]|uniref:Drug/metabolite transporter (DMT)-like permease n=1 Tax=Pseudochelatococcus lubricantis TaxID=1538102 RepID=A0ABX0UZQ5_9HYPH|nr:DMT family transporter [Pseudochelatococcus lubricantis]NIJ57440.1 drug/metabolite transporter (DMT)-like permease [Pseudochelatococcus lubricantis]
MSDTSFVRSSPVAANTTLAGIGLMVFGLFVFGINDVMGKWLVATYSVGQILLIRSAAAFAILAPFIWRAGLSSFRDMPHPRVQIIRALCGTADVALFYWAVAYLPLADVMTFYLAGPIYVTAMSAVFLGERVGPTRWTAVLVGFLGVLIALGPSIVALSWPSLIALAGSVAFSGLMVTTRLSRGTGDVQLVTVQVAAALVCGLIAAPFGWVTPDMTDFFMLGLLGVVSMSAFLCVNRALKLAPASVVVPYQYTLIVWAVVFGYVFFGEMPKATTLLGAAVIVGAGIFLFFREQANARLARAQQQEQEGAALPPRP